MKKLTLILSILISIFACKSDDDGGEEPIIPEKDYTYTQAEKDTEIEWIKSYIKENDIPAIATSSGLHYVIEKEGQGLIPEEGDTLICHFKTSNPKTGEVYGESNRENNDYGQALELNRLLEGVQEGFKLIKEGSVITMIVPSYLAYGKYGDFGGKIQPETIMMFRMELNIVLKQ